MLTQYFARAATLRERRSGMTDPQLDEFITWLERRGYQRWTIRCHIRGAVQFTLWAQQRHCTLGELDQTILEQFRQWLARRDALRAPSGNYTARYQSARLLVRFLEAHQLVTPRVASEMSPLPALFLTFCEWMRTQRGVRDQTLHNYRRPILALLAHLGTDPQHFAASEVQTFLLHFARQHSAEQAKNSVSALRRFVRFLSVHGYCTPDIVHAIPSVARWRLAALPKYLPGTEVDRLIRSCDRTTPLGLRDCAILLLLARLGLRAGDVAALRLTDLQWHEGTLTVAGKNRRATRLPLPQEVGDALLQYLQQGRPAVESVFVFITSVAPWVPITYQVVGRTVERALRRTGINAPTRGARLLRHSAATHLLRSGVSLPAIGALLRHASLETTTVYAKVDLPLLQQVVMPWPEVHPC
jgi:site-specific recombinase XerD